MPVTIDGTNGITNGGGYTGDGVSFADATPANTLVTTSAGNVGIGTSSPNFKLTVNGNFLNTYTTIAPGNTTSQFVGVSLSNPYTGGGDGFSFIDAQGRNSVTDSHIFFIHYADYGSAINFATQPAGTNTDRRAIRMTIGPSGLITAPAVYSTSVIPSRVVYTDTAGNLGYNASILAAKINVADLTDTDWLSALHPVTFNYRKLDEDRNYTDEAEIDLEYGLIAEEVEQVNPELVFYDQTENGPELRGVHYNKLIVPLLAKIQELEARLAAVEGAIA